MAKHAGIFKYIMLVYAFGFIAALTLDTDNVISSWDPGAGASVQAEHRLSPGPGNAGVKKASGNNPAPAPAPAKDI